MTLLHRLRKYAWAIGLDISRYSPRAHVLSRRKRVLEHCQIDCLLDVGASVGQFARQMRNLCAYRGKIISFEPQSMPFGILKQNAEKDGNWLAIKCAVGAKDGTTKINVSANSCSSSLLEMLPKHLESAPESKYVSTEQVAVKTLDTALAELKSTHNKCYLKIDTQGFGLEVLKGAHKTLEKVYAIQIEVSIVPLYNGEPDINEIITYLRTLGFYLVSIEEGFVDKLTDEILQIDCLFQRAIATIA